MNSNIYSVVDMHTMGEPTRIVTSGLPYIPGNTMIEKRDYMQNHYDHVRKLLMNEPRGHENMFGAVLVAPTNQNADYGVIFMDHGSYLAMCIHGSIGVATAAAKLGWSSKDTILLDTPAGLVTCKVTKDSSGNVKKVYLNNVPSFFVKTGSITLEDKIISYKIAFGGNFFALIDIHSLGMELDKKNATQLSKLGVKIRDLINRQDLVVHPELPNIRGVDLVEFYDISNHANVVVFGNGQIDRSPCGTGTSAQLSALFKEGAIKIEEEFPYRSIIGTEFVGKILSTTTVGEYNAIIPQIGGEAWVTSLSQMVLEYNDPLETGFSLSS